MSELRIKIKRQIEIIGLTLAQPATFTAADLEDMFDCTAITIKRDLSDIRSMGITIHSIPKKGIQIIGDIPKVLVRQLLEDYILLSHTEGSMNKAMGLLIETKQTNALQYFTQIQRAIETKNKLELVYKKNSNAAETKKTLIPLLLFEKQQDWRLLAIEDGKQKQYLLEKITGIKILKEKHSIQVENSTKELMSGSFGAWIGKNEIPITLLFTKSWLAGGKQPLIMESQITEQQTDGTFIVRCKVSYLEDVARWVVARGGEVIAIEPIELIKMICSFSRDALSVHSS